MPDYSNAATKNTERHLGPFEYDDAEEKLFDHDLVTRGPYELDNGAIYSG